MVKEEDDGVVGAKESIGEEEIDSHVNAAGGKENNTSYGLPPPVHFHMLEPTMPFVDHGNDPDPDETKLSRRTRDGRDHQFPEVLYKALITMDNEGRSNIACFFPHGRAFAILDKEAFVKDVLPRFFKQSKFTSFQRQLNLYLFRRINSPGREDHGGYWHPKFLRGRELLCKTIQRSKTRACGPRMKNTANPPDKVPVTCTLGPSRVQPHMSQPIYYCYPMVPMPPPPPSYYHPAPPQYDPSVMYASSPPCPPFVSSGEGEPLDYKTEESVAPVFTSPVVRSKKNQGIY